MGKKPLIFRTSYLLVCVSLFFIIMAGLALIVKTIPDENKRIYYIALCFGLGLSTITIPAAFKTLYYLFSEWSEKINDFIICETEDAEVWIKEKFDSFCQSKKIFLFGALFGLGATLVIFFYEIKNFGSIQLMLFAVFVVFVSEFIGGTGLYVLFNLSLSVRGLGKLPGCKVKVEKNNLGVLNTGSFLFKCWLIGIFCWIPYSIPVLRRLIVTGQPASEIFLYPPVLILTLPGFIFILGLFIFCQFPLHRLMIRDKQQEIKELQQIVLDLKPKQANDVSREIIDKTNFIENRLEQIQSSPEWPFTPKVLFGVAILSGTSLWVDAVFAAILIEIIKFVALEH